jgi:hypothetical protein
MLPTPTEKETCVGRDSLVGIPSNMHDAFDKEAANSCCSSDLILPSLTDSSDAATSDEQASKRIDDAACTQRSIRRYETEAFDETEAFETTFKEAVVANLFGVHSVVDDVGPEGHDESITLGFSVISQTEGVNISDD